MSVALGGWQSPLYTPKWVWECILWLALVTVRSDEFCLLAAGPWCLFVSVWTHQERFSWRLTSPERTLRLSMGAVWHKLAANRFCTCGHFKVLVNCLTALSKMSCPESSSFASIEQALKAISLNWSFYAVQYMSEQGTKARATWMTLIRWWFWVGMMLTYSPLNIMDCLCVLLQSTCGQLLVCWCYWCARSTTFTST